MSFLPPSLKLGDTIITVATSNWIPDDFIAQAKSVIESHGYNLKIHHNTQIRHHQQAGSPKERAQALHEAFLDSDSKAIIITSGGDRALHILDYLDFDMIKNNPKWICGYSDSTALLNAIYAKTGMATMHGLDINWIARQHQDNKNPQDIKSTFDAFQNPNTLHWPDHHGDAIRHGSFAGTLIGGNLCLLANLAGTEWMPPLKDAVLFLEDIDETPWNIDRMFLHIKRLTDFNQLKGLILGDFKNMGDKQNAAGVGFGLTLKDIALEHTSDINIPVLMNAPFGHRPAPLYPLTIGQKITWDGKKLII